MNPNLLFVYGILKRGFQLDLTKHGAKFIGQAQLPGANLYRIGHSGVGLRFVEDPNRVAFGEVFEIPDLKRNRYDDYLEQNFWRWLDSIEANGLAYTRKVVKVDLWDNTGVNSLHRDSIDAWVYEHTFPGARYDRLIESGKYEFVKDY